MLKWSLWPSKEEQRVLQILSATREMNVSTLLYGSCLFLCLAFTFSELAMRALTDAHFYACNGCYRYL